MRSPSGFSETSFSFSFVLTTAARKPRTEWGCQPVAFAMAAIVAPPDACSIPSTKACLEEREAVRVAVDRSVDEDDLALMRDAFAEVGFDAVDRAARACLLGGRVVVFLADLHFRFWIAIGNILCCDSIMRCHWQKLRNVRSPEEIYGDEVRPDPALCY